MKEKCVLVIDRDWRLRKLIRANLEPLGFRISEGVSGQHGLQRLVEDRPALILVGLDLPESEGLLFLEVLWLNAPGGKVPIIGMSAEPPSRRLLQQGRLAGYLPTPFAARDLLAEVQKVLGGLPPGD